MSTNTIAAPAPGIFWHRPDPGSAPFLVPGQKVLSGEAIGMIEVMKMFIEVHADRDGICKAYVAEDGETVPIGATLVELEEN